MKKELSIVKSIFEFFISRLRKSENWFYKSLKTYRKNYFSVIHSGNYNLDNYTDTIQYMLANILQKNISKDILILSADFFSFCAKYKNRSNSQFLQDLFVLYFLNNKKNGYFIEFGACDGIDLSNTLLLETKMHWSGILAEPDKYYFRDLIRNRNCNCCEKVIYKESGLKLQFSHVLNDAKLSTLTKYQSDDVHKDSREDVEVFEVSTITLDELLEQYDAPALIDYISIDTEGGELDILESYSYKKRRILCWTIEHNHNEEAREKISAIMNNHGYCRVLEGFSECDDWYVDTSIYNNKINDLKTLYL